MAEEDQKLQGADDQTPAPQANPGGQDDNQVLPLENQTPEEVEFNNLSGNAQERVRELVRRAKEAEERATATNSYVPPAPIAPQNVDVQDAVRKLSEVGIATKDDVDRTVETKLNQVRWEQEMSRLSENYSGKDGEPQFVRDEVEDYIRTHPQFMGYAPEDVFKFKMFPDDFVSGTQKIKRTPSLRPTRQATQENAMTVEYIAERTDVKKYPDAREWQEEHKAEIDKVLSNMG